MPNFKKLRKNSSAGNLEELMSVRDKNPNP